MTVHWTKSGRVRPPTSQGCRVAAYEGKQNLCKRGLLKALTISRLRSHWGSLLYYQDNSVLREILYLVYLMGKQLPEDLSIKPVNLTEEMHQLALLLWLRGLPLSPLTNPGIYYAKKALESIFERGLKGGCN